MEIESAKLIINKINNRKQNKLYYLAFIKFIAMIIIIKWHIINWPKRPIDYGARMCEILFISSGFLVGYNYYNKNIQCNYEASFKYYYKHLRQIYPLNTIITIIGFYIAPKRKNKFTGFELLMSNLLLIKSWSRFCIKSGFFTGHTWFLSSLLFSYFLSPLLLQGIKNIKRAIILFVCTSLIRIITEEKIKTDSINMFDINFHYGPVVRLLEFYMGMLLIPIFFYFKKYFDNYQKKVWFKVIFTIIHLVSPLLAFYFMKKYERILYRCYFVLIFCVFVFLSSYDYGYLNIFIENKIFLTIISYQTEIYLLQFIINGFFKRIINMKKFESLFHREIQFIIKLFIIFLFAFIYKLFCKEKLTKMLDKIIILFKKIIY